MYLLVIRDFHLFNDASYFGAQRSEVPSHVRIVSDLFNSAALPRIPVSCDCEDNHDCQYHHNRRSSEPLPRRCRSRRSRGGSRRVNGGRCGSWCWSAAHRQSPLIPLAAVSSTGFQKPWVSSSPALCLLRKHSQSQTSPLSCM